MKLTILILFAHLWRFLVSLQPKHWGCQYFTMWNKDDMPTLITLARHVRVKGGNKKELNLERIFWANGPVSHKDSFPVKKAKAVLEL